MANVFGTRGVTRRALLQTGLLSSVVCTLAPGARADEVGTAEGDVIVATKQGRLRGRRVGDVCEFRGVRYAEPQTPANRFKKPIPLKPWTGTRDAIVNGNQAMQFPIEARIWAAEFRDFSPMSEDCLFLNVYSPGVGTSRKRAVLVWCHGGGFATGSATVPVYDGKSIAAYGDVVVVAMNHRLSSFGYAHLRDIAGDEFADSGNAGMLDIVEALRWVRDNIAEFGGDPGNVTIAGESGGGAKVSILLAMPEASGLFHKAIVQSGSSLRQRTPDQASESSRKLLARLNLRPAEAGRLREVEAYELLTAALPIRGEFAPVVDGTHLPRHAFDPDAPATAKRIPMIIGTNQTEATNGAEDAVFHLDEASLKARLGSNFRDRTSTVIDAYRASHPDASPSDLYFRIVTDTRFRAAAIGQAERKVQQNGAQVYMYLFAWKSPVDGGKWQSPHAIDLPFMFRNQRMRVMQFIIGAGAVQDAVADAMTSAWVAFAKTGVPSNPITGTWDAYDLASRSTMVFDNTPTMVRDPDSADRKVFMAV